MPNTDNTDWWKPRRERIPSPVQMTPEEARRRSLMERMQAGPMAPGNEAFLRPEDLSNMSPEQLMRVNEMYNKPQMDINDAFFGDSEPVDPVEFIRRLLGVK